MTVPLPYFFDEADLASNANQPGDREKALTFSMDDLNWLKNAYLPTQAARTAHINPMHVTRLLLTPTGTTSIPLAGAFAMSRPDDGEVTLYTPWKGLIKFADMDDLKSKLAEWLEQVTGKRELLSFLSIKQRSVVLASTVRGISTAEIKDAVFQDQEQTIELNQAENITAMIGELVKTPTLQSMLDETFKRELAPRFPGLDQRLTRLESFIGTVSDFDSPDYRHITSSLSLNAALLRYYLTKQWPNGGSWGFSHPLHETTSDADHHAWENAIKEIAQSFTPYLRSLLKTFWNTSMNIAPMDKGLSRSAFFTESLRDTFHVNLLRKRQEGILTTQEYVRLMTVSRAGIGETPSDALRIEKIRVSALHKHYAELASTLMIGSTDTLGYLYTQSRGIEATNNLPEIKNIVLNMMKSVGHEDTLLNFMSLDERGTFLSLESNERLIIGEPIIGPVFEQLMADILAKQLQNFSHALGRYRESEGTLDPYALVDKALDIRGLIDDRLLAVDAGGRWSTQADQRWSAQPATVRAESAKKQLALLSTVEEALEQLIENHPAIPVATRTLADAHLIVGASLEGLQSSFAHTLSTALRSELKLHAVARTLGSKDQEIINTVLDSPVRLQRAALNGFLPDIFSLALKAGTSTDLLKLASCFVLTERGGLDPQHSGKAIVWTPARGFESFPSLPRLLTELERRLQDADERLVFLENLGRSEHSPGQSYSLAPLQLMSQNFFNQLQKPFVQLDQASVNHALSTALSATALSSLLGLVALRKPKTGLDRATDLARSLTTQQKLPVWLTKASIEDQILHAELLQQYLNNVNNDQDYLTGVRPLARTTHHDLYERLKADNFDIDPDTVEVNISASLMSAARTQTLTEFALIHTHDLDRANIKLASVGATAIPDGMGETYIKNLIRDLKPGINHRAILNTAFAETSIDAVARRKRFTAQLPWQLMHYAHTEKLQERLSEAGFDLIRQIMDMPDAIARAAVDGAHAIIRPLELMGIKVGQTIKVPGMYLIGSPANNPGPQVLIAPYSPRHAMKEYEDDEQLVAELKTRGTLHKWVLMNTPQPDRTLIESRMATTSERIGAVTLASNPIKGNLFRHLFNDNAALLARMLGCRTDNHAQDEWATIKHVLAEDLQEAFALFTGKLAYPITVWRSYRDIKQSAEDLQEHKWGGAIKAFISGIVQLATLRQSMEVTATHSSGASKPAPETPDTRLKWQDIDTTALERIRLQPHVSADVDLSAMTLNQTLGLYTHPTTKKHYAPVEGKVYPLEKTGDRWRICDSKTFGPYARQNTAKQWVVDPKMPAPHFNILNRLTTSKTVSTGMNIEANGLPEIRLLFPVKARAIDEGLDMATTYAWNSLRNLQLLKATGSRVTPVHQLIMDFLDVPTVLPKHVEKLEKVVNEIFAALLDPTLRLPKSNRFVVGNVTEYRESTFAFTVPTDKKKKLYLAEKFFFPNMDHYRNYLSDAGFPIRAHARAATLIHELSHIVCGTDDIAYLDSGRPFTDLIETTSYRSTQLKNALVDLQASALSKKSPLPQLFTVYNSDTALWEDFGDTSYEDTDQVLAHVLETTGQLTLSDARHVFKRDPMIRLAVQLSNADSVAWLISHLGRQLHTRTP